MTITKSSCIIYKNYVAGCKWLSLVVTHSKQIQPQVCASLGIPKYIVTGVLLHYVFHSGNVA